MSIFFFSCSNVNLTQPLSGNGADPLASPLSNLKDTKKQSLANTPSTSFTPGTWVETAMPDAEFYRKYPLFGGRPDRNLQVASQAKIISYRGKYAKVELDTGDVGYVPSLMLIEKGEDNDDYYSSESSPSNKRIPIVSSSDPPPPSEDEILQKIRERENQEPTIEIPASNDFVAPEPEIRGVTVPNEVDNSSTQISPPTPTIPRSIPEVTSPIDDENIIAPKPVIAPAIITPAPSTGIQIDKPVDTSSASSITAPIGDRINQDAALELRITEPFSK